MSRVSTKRVNVNIPYKFLVKVWWTHQKVEMVFYFDNDKSTDVKDFMLSILYFDSKPKKTHVDSNYIQTYTLYSLCCDQVKDIMIQ